MFDPKNRIHWVAAIVIALFLILIFGVTSSGWGQEAEVPVVSFRSEKPGPCGTGPAYLPRDVEPRLEEPEAVRESLEKLQAAERPDGAGRVILWVCVLETGTVGGILVHTTSGDDRLDSIALRTISEAAFTPARRADEPVAVWIAQPLNLVQRPEKIDL